MRESSARSQDVLACSRESQDASPGDPYSDKKLVVKQREPDQLSFCCAFDLAKCGEQFYDTGMPKKLFFTFHYRADNWRVSQIRNIGAVVGSPLLKDNEWESIERQGEAAIQRWIDAQMAGMPCAAVLIGSSTAGRKWVDYEIKKAWNDKKGLFGIYIHNLQDRNGNTAFKGANPFDSFTVGGTNLAQIVRTYDPAGYTSQDVYRTIANSIEGWIDEAIAIRNRYR